jgi:hypothetical protein
MIQKCFPVLHKLIIDEPKPEYIYFCIKFLCKCVHLNMNQLKKRLTMKWMPLLQEII